jgi:putative transposase
MESGPDVFSSQRARQEGEQAAREAELYEQIGRLKMELEWIKKSYLNRLKGNER